MPIATADWHIHSHHSPCPGAEASLAEIVEHAAQAGMTEFGLTDHLHCRLSIPSLRAARREFDEMAPVPGFHFAVEVSCLREWDLEQNDALGENGRIQGVQKGGGEGKLTTFLPEEIMEELKFEYVIGGAHWPLGAAVEREAMIRSYHRQNMFMAGHPRVDIVAHPWWWMGEWENDDGTYTTLPWFDDFRVIPKSMHLEFAAAIREKAVEINAGMLNAHGYPDYFPEQYRNYLALLKETGATLALGSDSHGPGSWPSCLNEIEDHLQILGLREEELWRPGAKDQLILSNCG